MTKTDLWFNCDTSVLNAFHLLCAINGTQPETVLNAFIERVIVDGKGISL